jgi:hypothetical protein
MSYVGENTGRTTVDAQTNHEVGGLSRGVYPFGWGHVHLFDFSKHNTMTNDSRINIGLHNFSVLFKIAFQIQS